jgi:hypothetical protein
MVNFLEQEVKRKDMANKTLSKQLRELTQAQVAISPSAHTASLDTQVADKKLMKRHFEKTLKQAEKLFLEKESQLLAQNKQLMQEASNLSQFKQMRHELAAELEKTTEVIAQNEVRRNSRRENVLVVSEGSHPIPTGAPQQTADGAGEEILRGQRKARARGRRAHRAQPPGTFPSHPVHNPSRTHTTHTHTHTHTTHTHTHTRARSFH